MCKLIIETVKLKNPILIIETEEIVTKIGKEQRIERKYIKGSINLKFQSSGDMSSFINDDGNVDMEFLFDKIIESLNNNVNMLIELDDRINISFNNTESKIDSINNSLDNLEESFNNGFSQIDSNIKKVSDNIKSIRRVLNNK